MRAMILLGGATLALAACGSNGTVDENEVAEAGLTAEAITANDVTAIDAVTGDAANMAADVDYADFPARDTTEGSTTRIDRPRTTTQRAAQRPASDTSEPAASTNEPEDQPAGNSTE